MIAQNGRHKVGKTPEDNTEMSVLCTYELDLKIG